MEYCDRCTRTFFEVIITCGSAIIPYVERIFTVFTKKRAFFYLFVENNIFE